MVFELKNKQGQKHASHEITQQSSPWKNRFFKRENARQKPTHDAAQAAANKN
jgi:hypothetical protein